MNPVEIALWYVESHLRDELSLGDVAARAGVSRFHLARAFAAVTGMPVMRYVRGRRLTEAAQALAALDGDILGVALEFGYGSHEAFTRAFRDQFGVVPQQVLGRRTTEHLILTEAFRMNTQTIRPIADPHLAQLPALLIAGLARTYSGTNAGMAAQWGEFAPWLGQVPGQQGAVAYGVLYNDTESGIDYLTGVAVDDFGRLPPALARLRIAPRRYAVFGHAGHVASIAETWQSIWSDWFPRSGMTAADAPMFERYSERFDPRTGFGGFELWIPLDGDA